MPPRPAHDALRRLLLQHNQVDVSWVSAIVDGPPGETGFLKMVKHHISTDGELQQANAEARYLNAEQVDSHPEITSGEPWTADLVSAWFNEGAIIAGNPVNEGGVGYASPEVTITMGVL